MAFKVSEKPERWLLDLRCLVVWREDPEGMCVRVAGVCRGVVCAPSKTSSPLQGFSL